MSTDIDINLFCIILSTHQYCDFYWMGLFNFYANTTNYCFYLILINFPDAFLDLVYNIAYKKYAAT